MGYDFDKSDSAGISLFLEAISSAGRDLAKLTERLVNESMSQLAGSLDELFADDEVDVNIIFEWEVKSNRFRNLVLSKIKAALKEEGLHDANIKLSANHEGASGRIWWGTNRRRGW